ARGFYDRLPMARQACVDAARTTLLDQTALAGIAQAHGVCPYYLSQEMARWADVVVGDYNYYFDANAMLHGLAQANQWRVGVLVDEAHNLVERGRKMYSAELDQDSLRALKTTAPAALRKPLDRLLRSWSALNRSVTQDYQVFDAIPEAWLGALQHAIGAITTFFSEHPTDIDAPLQTFYLEALHFARLADTFDAHTLCDLSRRSWASGGLGAGRTSSTLSLRNVIPAP